MSVPLWHTIRLERMPIESERQMRRFARQWEENVKAISKALGIAGRYMAREFRSAGWIRG